MAAKIFEVQIVPTQKERVNLSPGQKTFNQLIQKIQREREHLEAWNAVIPLYQQKYLRDLKPLLDQIRAHKLTWLRQMDHLYLQHHFTKNEKIKLSAVICDVAEELMHTEMLDELKEIYNRHNPQDYDAENQEQVELLKARFSEDFDYQFSDDEQFASPEDVLAFMRKKMKALAEEELAVQEARKLHTKKSAKVSAKEEAQTQMQRSLREVFRRLVQDLHPDREQDPLERERKNALMQRVNAAYEAGDLLTLFELQVEISQIDQAALQAMNDERLQNYNKILRQQLADLKQQVESVTMPFVVQMQMPVDARGEPDRVLSLLNHEVVQLKRQLRGLESDMRAFMKIDQIKDWLKTLR